VVLVSGRRELMPQKEVLDFKPAPRLEQIGDKCGQQMEDREHNALILPHRANPAGWNCWEPQVEVKQNAVRLNLRRMDGFISARSWPFVRKRRPHRLWRSYRRCRCKTQTAAEHYWSNYDYYDS
jgi:hypothetical protein